MGRIGSEIRFSFKNPRRFCSTAEGGGGTTYVPGAFVRGRFDLLLSESRTFYPCVLYGMKDGAKTRLSGRGTVVERRSLTGELSVSCARPAADG